MSTPGNYPPQDPWGQQNPAGQGAAGGQPQPPYGQPQQPQQPPYGQSPYGQPQQPPYGQPTPQAPPYGQPAPANWDAPTSQFAGVGQPAYGAPGQPAYGAPGQYPPGAYGGPPAGGGGNGRKKAGIIGLVTVVVIALLAGGYFLFFKSDSPTMTFDGKKIDKPDAVLTAAEANLAAIVKTRHGVSGSDTRCYFATPKTPAAGGKKSDIDHSLLCGPVLFVDGDASREYLPFALTSAPASGGSVTLTAATTASRLDPEAVPSGFALTRPDKAGAPSGTGGLKVPAPPAADANFLGSVSLGNSTVPAAPTTAVIGAQNGGLRLSTLGEVDRYGVGDDARSAPTGQKLIAFTIGSASSASGLTSGFSALTVRVAVGTTVRAVPSGSNPIVVAVPTGSDASIQVTDSGLTQSVSLVTGKPAADNIAVGQRKNHSQTINKTLSINDRWSYPGVASINRPARLVVDSAELSYWGTSTSSRTAHPTSRANAYLIMDMTYTYLGAPTGSFTSSGGLGPFGVTPAKLSLRLPDGRVIKAKDIDSRTDFLLDAFEVPADFTTGTVVLSGATTNVNNVTSSYTPSASFTVGIAAG